MAPIHSFVMVGNPALNCMPVPFETSKSLGVHNVINAALDNEVKRVVFTSSDKAAMSAEEAHDYIVENRLIEDLEDGRLA